MDGFSRLPGVACSTPKGDIRRKAECEMFGEKASIAHAMPQLHRRSNRKKQAKILL